MIDACFLESFRGKALRRKVWYRLNRLDRDFFNLTVRVVDRVRSLELARILVGILARVRDLLKGAFRLHVESYGLGKAVALVELAEAWGNRVFRFDVDFAWYLAFIDFNNPTGWRSF